MNHESQEKPGLWDQEKRSSLSGWWLSWANKRHSPVSLAAATSMCIPPTICHEREISSGEHMGGCSWKKIQVTTLQGNHWRQRQQTGFRWLESIRGDREFSEWGGQAGRVDNLMIWIQPNYFNKSSSWQNKLLKLWSPKGIYYKFLLVRTQNYNKILFKGIFYPWYYLGNFPFPLAFIWRVQLKTGKNSNQQKEVPNLKLVKVGPVDNSPSTN